MKRVEKFLEKLVNVAGEFIISLMIAIGVLHLALVVLIKIPYIAFSDSRLIYVNYLSA
jgi:hypothetical protein